MERYVAFGSGEVEITPKDEAPPPDQDAQGNEDDVQSFSAEDDLKSASEMSVRKSREGSVHTIHVDDEDDAKGKNLKKIFSDITAKEFSKRQRLHHIVYGTPALSFDARVSAIYNVVHVTMIVISTVLFIVMSMPELYEPEMKTNGTAFAIESCTVAFFTLDFVLRLVAATQWRNVIALSTLVDFVSFFGYYIELIILYEGTEATGLGFVFLRMLRLGRVFRLFKLSRSQKGLSMMMQVVAKSKDGLFLLAMLVCIAVLVFASILYYIELIDCSFNDADEQWIRSDGTISPFQSIPHTFWFISVSITTVGYGDEVPISIGGRLWVMVVMLFGVLVLSFPNILIGSNFSDVHRNMSRTKARRQLGVYFRRVRMVVRFIRMWREFRVKGRITFGTDDNQEQQTTLLRRMNNFVMRLSDFPDHRLGDVVDSVISDNIDHLKHSGLAMLNVLQRMLEGFSSCCTIEELAQSYTMFPLVHQPSGGLSTIIFELVLRSSALQYTNLFVVSREDGTGVAQLTKRGVELLQNYPESNAMPCMRCYVEAREIWMQTTKMIPFDFLPIDGYRNWQAVQARMRRRPVVDFVYDMRLPDARNNDIYHGMIPRPPRGAADQSKCFCRFCNETWGIMAPVRPSSDYCFQPDEEYMQLELTYATQQLEIFRLEKKLFSLTGEHREEFVAVGDTGAEGRNGRQQSTLFLKADTPLGRQQSTLSGGNATLSGDTISMNGSGVFDGDDEGDTLAATINRRASTASLQ